LTTTFSRTALIAALAAGLLLAGCGRKGGLEAPPSASLANPPTSAQPTLGEPEHDALEGERRPPAERAAAQKKSFPLDFLVTGERERERERVREQRAKEEAAAPRR
jgi:predicted small lipoprotein YifL